MFCFLWDQWTKSDYFENRIRLKPVIGDVNSLSHSSAVYIYMLTKTESTSFVLLCNLCFQKPTIQIFILFHCSWCKILCGGVKRPNISSYCKCYFNFLFDHWVHSSVFFVFFFFFFFFFFSKSRTHYAIQHVPLYPITWKTDVQESEPIPFLDWFDTARSQAWQCDNCKQIL